MTIPTFEGLARNAENITSVPVQVGGTLYFTLSDHVWAIDARTGRRRSGNFYRPAPGTHAVNRGVAISGNHIFFGTADAHLISLDARTGKKVWDVTLGDVRFGQAITMAPLVIRNYVIVGSSGDGADVSGFVAAVDVGTGKPQWKWDAVPKPGQSGADTWPSGKAGEDIMAHGGGNPSMTPTYDPLNWNLLYIGTGAPRPAFAGDARLGANLYTSSIVALNADTGKIAWYFQASPHETHNWGAVETPVLFDAEVRGEHRKLLAQSSMNGYFFVLDRSTGKNVLTVPFAPMRTGPLVSMQKDNRSPRRTRSREQMEHSSRRAKTGATSWPPPSYSPDTKLFYVNAHLGSYGMFYLTSKSPVPKGLAGIAREVGRGSSALVAIDSTTGKIRWTADAGGLGGVLTTAGGLVFTSGSGKNVLALDAATGKVLWHTRVGSMANSAITYELDERQYVVTPIEDMIYAWVLPKS